MKDLTVITAPYVSIRVKYLPTTNTKGSRWKVVASSGGESIVISYRHQDHDGGRAYAARLLLEKRGWTGTWIGSDISPTETIFVNADWLETEKERAL